MALRIGELLLKERRITPEQLQEALAYQKGKAPLIFVIAGTGAGFNSDKMLDLQSIFYRAGFHVVSISSPTPANFAKVRENIIKSGRLGQLVANDFSGAIVSALLLMLVILAHSICPATSTAMKVPFLKRVPSVTLMSTVLDAVPLMTAP